MTLPCDRAAPAPQIDLQAFIKAARGYAGQRSLGWSAAWMCVCVCACDSPPLYGSAHTRMCVCEEKGSAITSRSSTACRFITAFKATAQLHRVQSCKNFFFCLLFFPPLLFLLILLLLSSLRLLLFFLQQLKLEPGRTSAGLKHI